MNYESDIEYNGLLKETDDTVYLTILSDILNKEKENNHIFLYLNELTNIIDNLYHISSHFIFTKIPTKIFFNKIANEQFIKYQKEDTKSITIFLWKNKITFILFTKIIKTYPLDYIWFTHFEQFKSSFTDIMFNVYLLYLKEIEKNESELISTTKDADFIQEWRNRVELSRKKQDIREKNYAIMRKALE
ncbi:MAG: hypothetical protein WC934_06870 [Acidithiobacillus sp.]|jgi:hypothetical protein|uniref:hypothetical protein n=1 Tax=Acidithiobacillus sp. TaxID=1872118 RepID=UPI00356113C4